MPCCVIAMQCRFLLQGGFILCYRVPPGGTCVSVSVKVTLSAECGVLIPAISAPIPAIPAQPAQRLQTPPHKPQKKVPSALHPGLPFKYLILLRQSDPIWLLSLCLTRLRILQCTGSVRRDLPCCREYTPLSLWSFYHSLLLQHILSLMSDRN